MADLKAAGDEVFESLQPMFAERAARAAAGETKQKLLVELRELVQPSTNVMMRDDAEGGMTKAERSDRIKALQEWKEAGPAPRDIDQDLRNIANSVIILCCPA